MIKFPPFKIMALPLLVSAAIYWPADLINAAEATDNSEDKENNDSVIVIVGSKIEQDLDDVAGSVSVMSEEQIQQQAVSDMSDLFRYEPGLEISGSAGTEQNFTIRGMGGDRVMMIKDGMRMNEGYGANGANNTVGRGFIDVDTIKQVEVAKGASSSLFGADALAGVVVFRTKDPEDYLGDEDFYLKVNAGWDRRSNLHSAGFTTALVTGPVKHMLNFKGSNGDETKNYDDTKLPPLATETESILYKMSYDIDHHQKLGLSVDLYNQMMVVEDSGQPVIWLGQPVTRQEASKERDSDSYALTYTNANVNSAIMDTIEAKLYNTKSVHNEVADRTIDMTSYYGYILDKINDDIYSQDTSGLSLAFSKVIKSGSTSHTISYGLDYDETETIRTKDEERYLLDGTQIKDQLDSPFPFNVTTRIGLYLQDQIEMGNLQLVPGIRFDDYEMDVDENDPLYLLVAEEGHSDVKDIEKTHASSRLGAIYSLNDKLNLYAQYSSGFKVPPYDLAYISHDGSAFGAPILEPAESIEPEESDSYEIGLRGSFKDINFTLSAYYNDYTNMISIIQVGEEVVSVFSFDCFCYVDRPIAVVQYGNIASTTIKGLELDMQYYFNDNWSIYGTATSMDAKDNETGDYLSSMRPLSGTLGVVYSDDDYSVNLVTKLADNATDVLKYEGEDSRKTAGYGVVDLMINYEITDNINLNFSVFNLLDKAYTKYSRVAGLSENPDTDWSYYNEAGRKFSVRVSYEF